MTETENGAAEPKRRRRSSGDAAATPAQPLTTYLVMKGVDHDEGQTAWLVAGETSAHSREQAREKFVNGLPEGSRSGVFKAVAKSAWQGGAKSYTEQQVLSLIAADVEE